MGSSLLQWRLLNRTKDRQMAMLANQPQIRREVAEFRKTLPLVSSAEELVKNEKAYRVTMVAFGLEDQIYARALVRKVLESDLSDPKSFAMRMSSVRFRELAAAFNFNTLGDGRPKDPAFAQHIVDRFLVQRFEEQAGQSNEALRFGLYFDRKAAGLTSWYHVLADPALAKVARTALGLPEEAAQVPVDRQVDLLKDRYDIARFQDPVERARFLDRFMTLHDVAYGGPAGAAAASPVLGLFAPPGQAPVISGLSPASLLAAATLRRRF